MSSLFKIHAYAFFYFIQTEISDINFNYFEVRKK